MNKSLSKLLIIFLVFLASLFMLSGSALAAGPNLPLLDYVGDFTYCDGSRGGSGCGTGGARNDFLYLLYFDPLNITGGNYLDGTQFGAGSGVYDVVEDAWFEIGNLYNDEYPQHLTFGPDQPAGGSTGPVSFTLTDGTNDFFTGTIDNFVLTEFFGNYSLNTKFDQENIDNLTFYSGSPYSRYVDEFQNQYDAVIASGSSSRPNFAGSFSFLTGSSADDFTGDGHGTIQGKLAAAPEPVSSILFLSGAATLGVRRFWKKKKIATG